MGIDLRNRLVIAISTRALFDLEQENLVFEQEGEAAYRDFQLEREEEVLSPGAAFPLVKAFLRLNQLQVKKPLVEVIVMSRNSPDLGLRVFNSIRHFDLDITRAAFSSGESLAPYLKAFSVDLFLSKSAADVQQAIDTGFAAAQIYDPPQDFNPDSDQIRVAFDADSVIFSDESEEIYKRQGLEAFLAHEEENARKPLPEGPFARLLKTLSLIQHSAEDDSSPVRIALVTARNSPAHERVIRTLRLWNVSIDEAFFLGGISKDEVLKAFRAHIFFDDQHLHVDQAAKVVPAARVPYHSDSKLNKVVGK